MVDALIDQRQVLEKQPLLSIAHMKEYGTTREQIAGVTAKNSFHGSLNPNAQFREVLSVDQAFELAERRGGIDGTG